MAELIVRRDGAELARVRLDEAPVLIGRSDRATLRLTDPLASNEHARVTRAVDGAVVVMDLASRNGTSVNGERLAPRETRSLAAGDVFVVGRSAIALTGDAEEQEPPEPTLCVAPAVGARRGSAGFESSTVMLRLDSFDAGWAAARGPDEEILALLWQEGEALNRLSDKRAILTALRNLLARALAPARVFVLERSPDRSSWQAPVTDGAHGPSKTIARQAAARRSAVLVCDAPTDARVAGARSVQVNGISSALAAPIFARGEAVHVLYADRQGGAPFSLRDLRLVAVLANHASAAIENSAHLAALASAKADLAALNRELERKVEERTAEVRRQADEIARLAAEKDELIGMAAHDIRSPLSGVLGLVELARADSPRESDAARSFQVMEDTIRRVLALVSDLLDVKKVEAGRIAIERTRTSARTFVEEAIGFAAPLAHRKHITLTVETEPGIVVEIDARRLGQAVQNLVANAIKFTPKGGHVKVRGRAVEGGFEVAVEDDGPGIAAAELPRLFGRFEQGAEGRRTRESFGLGLAIAKKLVELHGGRIWVESVEDKGSRFAFFVPGAHAAGARAA